MTQPHSGSPTEAQQCPAWRAQGGLLLNRPRPQLQEPRQVASQAMSPEFTQLTAQEEQQEY